MFKNYNTRYTVTSRAYGEDIKETSALQSMGRGCSKTPYLYSKLQVSCKCLTNH